MARFFFSVEGGSLPGDDCEGMELAGHEEARVEATVMLGKMLSDDAQGFWTAKELRLTVSDENGMILFVVDISGIEAPAAANERTE